jgi:hypothetical protein
MRLKTWILLGYLYPLFWRILKLKLKHLIPKGDDKPKYGLDPSTGRVYNLQKEIRRTSVTTQRGKGKAKLLYQEEIPLEFNLTQEIIPLLEDLPTNLIKLEPMSSGRVPTLNRALTAKPSSQNQEFGYIVSQIADLKRDEMARPDYIRYDPVRGQIEKSLGNATKDIIPLVSEDTALIVGNRLYTDKILDKIVEAKDRYEVLDGAVPTRYCPNGHVAVQFDSHTNQCTPTYCKDWIRKSSEMKTIQENPELTRLEAAASRVQAVFTTVRCDDCGTTFTTRKDKPNELCSDCRGD